MSDSKRPEYKKTQSREIIRERHWQRFDLDREWPQGVYQLICDRGHKQPRYVAAAQPSQYSNNWICQPINPGEWVCFDPLSVRSNPE